MHLLLHSITPHIRQQGTNQLSLLVCEVRVKHIHNQHQARCSTNVHGVFKAVVEHQALTCAPVSCRAIHRQLGPANTAQSVHTTHTLATLTPDRS